MTAKVIDLEINGDENFAAKKTNSNVVSFQDICYTVEEQDGCCGCLKPPKKKKILSSVSGVMSQGLNAIMGPTGSGKSSLLDVLAKRKDPRWLSGSVLLNGKKLPSNYKYIRGYVVQNDILMATLTVRECFWFSANLRLPRRTGHKQKKERVEELLEQLGLQRCANSKIGNEIIRGISGGERKRTSIGVELVTRPSVLYLDEPTTGLDASTANSVMRLLKKISMTGQTIILSIHQPRFSIFRLFDSLTLLSLGKCVYHGEAVGALPYFEALGYQCETHNNPADYLLDVINGEVEASSNSEHANEIMFDTETKHERDVTITNMLSDRYKQSQLFADCQHKLVALNKTSQTDVKIVGDNDVFYATSSLYQIRHLLKRDFMNVLRNPQGLLGNLGINLIIGVVFGLLYLNVDNTPTTGTQNRFGLLFFITTNILFGSINVIELFINEKSLFIHEYVSGYYRIGSYFIAKLLADLIPMRTLAPLFYSIVTYWMVGLKADPAAFFIFLLVSTLGGYCAVGIGTFFSTTFSNFAVASLCMVLVYVFSIVFSGLLVNVDSILSWLAWIQYLSIARFTLVGLSVNEFVGQNFSACYTTEQLEKITAPIGGASATRNGNLTCLSISGEEYLHDALSVESSADEIDAWTLWQNVVALGCISIGLFVLTYIQLVRTRKYS